MRKAFALLSAILLLACSCELFYDAPECAHMHIVSLGYDFKDCVSANNLYDTVNDAIQVGHVFTSLANRACIESDVRYLIGTDINHVGNSLQDATNVPDASLVRLPTLNNLKSALGEVRDIACEDDITVIFMSTHGLPDARFAFKSDSIEGAYELASWDNILPLITSIHGKKLILLDACYSGAIVQEGGVTVNTEVYPGSSPWSVLGLDVPSSVSSDIWCLSASAFDTKSYEAGRHGFFTGALLRCLGWDAESDEGFATDIKGKVTAYGLARYVCVNDGQEKQRPMLSGSSADLVLFDF